MTLLTIIRHRQSTYNLQNRFMGNLDVLLTRLSRAEARLVDQKLKDFHFDFAYTSMLIRA